MAEQKNLLKRLTAQLRGRGEKNPKSLAVALLRKQGNMKKDSTELTSKGKKRQAMGAAGRAKDRAAKASGRKPEDFKYSKQTNRAKVKK